MIGKPIEIDGSKTNNIEALFHALFHLQRTPGCEKVAEGVAEKLREEFLLIPEKKKKTGEVVRYYNGLNYHSNGVVTMTHYPYYAPVILEKWDTDTVVPEPEPKQRKERNPSYAFLKRVNLIWYLQVARHRKRRAYATRDEKIQVQSLVAQKAVYDEFSEDEEGFGYEKEVESRLLNEVKKFYELFQIDYRELHMPGSVILDLPKSFFFLTPVECEKLASTIENTIFASSPRAYDSYEVNKIAQALTEIIKEKHDEREWILHPEWPIYKIEKEMIKTSWGELRQIENMVFKWQEVLEHYEDALEDVSEENMKFLNAFGLTVKEKEVAASE